ncbi:kinase-like domain-containing protein, partial [Pelagophyceae sp. CCMP2097]
RYSLEFEERSALGDGGFGTVTLSVNRLDGTEYAIKKIRLSSAIRWRPRLDKMLREVKILALLDHPNIVRYYQAWLEECAAPDPAQGGESDLAGADFGGEAGAAAVSMQYCASKTLSEYLGARPAQSLGEVDLETARRIFVQIARGLRYVHSCGLVHRDLKPANIFLTAEGTVKIGDFGLSRYAAEAHADGDAAAAAATHLEALGGGGGDLSVGVGTRAYAAPEQLSSDDYGQQADIFSLGLVLFEMVHPKFATAMERA